MDMTTTTSAILGVVRGNVHWRTLRTHGIDIRLSGKNTWEFGAYSGEPVLVSADDILQGIEQQIDDETRILEWARFVLAASDLVNLDRVDDSEGELLDCIWDISYGKLDCAKKFTNK